MTKFNRSITIEFDSPDDDDYCEAANFLWHAARMTGLEFRALHDKHTNATKLNDQWDEMGATARWR